LSAVPTDFVASKHDALTEENFADDKLDVFFNMKAEQAQAKADAWKRKAASFARFGGIADRKTAQKVEDSLAAMRKSLETLAAQGVDLSTFDAAILAACGIVPAAK
jgi:chloramphenicol 3-O-phosphotransferase